MRLWDNQNKKWMNVTSIFFYTDGTIHRITAMEEGHTNAITQGWWVYEKPEHLAKVAIDGIIKHNVKLIPKVTSKLPKKPVKKK